MRLALLKFINVVQWIINFGLPCYRLFNWRMIEGGREGAARRETRETLWILRCVLCQPIVSLFIIMTKWESLFFKWYNLNRTLSKGKGSSPDPSQSDPENFLQASPPTQPRSHRIFIFFLEQVCEATISTLPWTGPWSHQSLLWSQWHRSLLHLTAPRPLLLSTPSSGIWCRGSDGHCCHRSFFLFWWRQNVFFFHRSIFFWTAKIEVSSGFRWKGYGDDLFPYRKDIIEFDKDLRNHIPN